MMFDENVTQDIEGEFGAELVTDLKCGVKIGCKEILKKSLKGGMHCVEMCLQQTELSLVFVLKFIAVNKQGEEKLSDLAIDIEDKLSKRGNFNVGLNF